MQSQGTEVRIKENKAGEEGGRGRANLRHQGSLII